MLHDKLDSLLIRDAARIAEAGVYDGYSGRAMYGEECFGVTGSLSEYSRFIANVGFNDIQLASDLAGAVRTDQLGHDNIYYFPNHNIQKVEATI
jgi:hypothetical protein